MHGFYVYVCSTSVLSHVRASPSSLTSSASSASSSVGVVSRGGVVHVPLPPFSARGSNEVPHDFEKVVPVGGGQCFFFVTVGYATCHEGTTTESYGRLPSRKSLLQYPWHKILVPHLTKLKDVMGLETAMGLGPGSLQSLEVSMGGTPRGEREAVFYPPYTSRCRLVRRLVAGVELNKKTITVTPVDLNLVALYGVGTLVVVASFN